METIDLINGKLKSFIQEMHDWEIMCNEIDLDNNLSFEQRFQKQKQKATEIFNKYCTVKDRKYGRPNTISYGVNECYEYDLNEENILETIEETKTRVIVHTERKDPMQEKYQYIFMCKKGEWLIDSKKRFSNWKNKWINVSL